MPAKARAENDGFGAAIHVSFWTLAQPSDCAGMPTHTCLPSTAYQAVMHVAVPA